VACSELLAQLADQPDRTSLVLRGVPTRRRLPGRGFVSHSSILVSKVRSLQATQGGSDLTPRYASAVFASPEGVVFLVLWLLALAAVGAIAQRKGRSRRRWVLATVFFGPIAVVALFAWPNRVRASPAQLSEQHVPVAPI
jgi:hypothetical protein